MAAKKPTLYPFQVQFSSVDSVSTENGTLMGVTVAEIGTATGHFCFLDRDGKILGTGGFDEKPPLTAKLLPLCMDEKSLQTLVACAEDTGRIKTREDHDDSIGSRAGHADNFRIVGDKAVCDLSILSNYRNRGVFMETAEKTPELMGLSGDMQFNIEIAGDCAFMRVEKINAVDIVDRGALTHAGLFAAKAAESRPGWPSPEWPSVDNTKKPERPLANPKLVTKMAHAKTAVSSEDMPDIDQFTADCAKMGEYMAAHQEHAAKIHAALAGIAPVKVPTGSDAPAPVTGAPDNPKAHIPDPAAAFSAKLSEITTALAGLKDIKATIQAEVKAAVVDLQKDKAALGIKAAAAPTGATETIKAAEGTPTEPTTYKGWAEKFAADRKVTVLEGYKIVAREKPEVYNRHVLSLGQRN